MSKINNLPYALAYAAMGWPVFPCRHFGTKVKAPVTVHGFHDATTDTKQITEWWTTNPKALIGIPTGKTVGFWVVDIDKKNGKDGEQSLRDMFGDELFEEATMIQKTPSGGLHVLFKWDEARKVNCGSDILDGVDLRGEGGYIVAMPSGYYLNDVFKQYMFNECDIISEAPEWAYTLAGMKGKHSTSDGALDLLHIIEGVKEGGRDEALNRFAWLLAGKDIPADLALAFMQTAASKCRPPLDYAVVEYQLQRAYSQKQTKNKDIDNILSNAQNKNKKEAK